MSGFFPKPLISHKDINVGIGISNYATKFDFKGGGVNTSSFA